MTFFVYEDNNFAREAFGGPTFGVLDDGYIPPRWEVYRNHRSNYWGDEFYPINSWRAEHEFREPHRLVDGKQSFTTFIEIHVEGKRDKKGKLRATKFYATMKFGRNGQGIWLFKGSCKTVQDAIRKVEAHPDVLSRVADVLVRAAYHRPYKAKCVWRKENDEYVPFLTELGVDYSWAHGWPYGEYRHAVREPLMDTRFNNNPAYPGLVRDGERVRASSTTKSSWLSTGGGGDWPIPSTWFPPLPVVHGFHIGRRFRLTDEAIERNKDNPLYAPFKGQIGLVYGTPEGSKARDVTIIWMMTGEKHSYLCNDLKSADYDF